MPSGTDVTSMSAFNVAATCKHIQYIVSYQMAFDHWNVIENVKTAAIGVRERTHKCCQLTNLWATKSIEHNVNSNMLTFILSTEQTKPSNISNGGKSCPFKWWKCFSFSKLILIRHVCVFHWTTCLWYCVQAIIMPSRHSHLSICVKCTFKIDSTVNIITTATAIKNAVHKSKNGKRSAHTR